MNASIAMMMNEIQQMMMAERNERKASERELKSELRAKKSGVGWVKR